MHFKNRFSDYTEAEFTLFIIEIFGSESGESYQDALLEIFIAVTEHPEGSDLIYYSDDDDNLTPDKVVAAVRE